MYTPGPTLSCPKPVTIEYRKALINMKSGPDNKFRQRDFLQAYEIKFSHHRRSQDVIYHWKVCLHCTQPAILPIALYHQRFVNPPRGTAKWKHIHCVTEVYTHLKKIYEQWEELLFKVICTF